MKRFFATLRVAASRAYHTLFPHSITRHGMWPVFLAFVCVVSIIGFSVAHAGIVEDVAGGIVDVLARLVIEIAKLCIFLTVFFLKFFITLASYNNFIDVSVVQLGWVMVRDLANMFFIVGLLVIAFATILGFESYEWKHGVVKIVLMAILINFSNLIAQLIIDVAHIFTITFLNAVSATAGGNLIQMFQFDKILALTQDGVAAIGTPGSTGLEAKVVVFGGAVLALIFALLAAVSLGAYLFVMIARIVVLWALIVLSPLAFMLYALPKGEDYAHEWWSEFTKHVIVAPIMVFFLWLAFATLGTGQILSEIQNDSSIIRLTQGETESAASITSISTWENMASFLLAIGFLLVGIKKTEETGATGAHLIGTAVDFGKRVATIATGYAAGRWLVGGAVSRAPIVGSNSLSRYGTVIKGAAGYAGAKLGAARDMKYQDWEKKAADKKASLGSRIGYGFLKNTVGTLLATEKKKDAAAGTWEEAAHYADETHEARISNSATKGGQTKDKERIRAEFAVKSKEAKGVEKGSKGFIDLLEDKDKSLLKSMETITDSGIRGHDLQELAEAIENEEYLDHKDRLSETADLVNTKGLTDEQRIEKVKENENRKREEENKHALEKYEEAKAKAATKKGAEPPKAPKLQEMMDDAGAKALLKTAKSYYETKNSLRTKSVKNEWHESALKDEGEKKKALERLKQLKTDEKFKDYDARATKASVELESAKKRFEVEAKKGVAEKFDYLMEHSDEFKNREEESARISAEVKGLEDRKNAEKELMLLKQIADLLKTDGSVLQKSLEQKAKLDIFKEDVFDVAQITKAADIRAGAYEGVNDPLRAQATRKQAAAQLDKKNTELFNNLDFTERTTLERFLIDEIQKEATAGTMGSEKMKKLQRQKNTLATLNTKMDGETAMSGRLEAMRALGTEQLDDSNRLIVELQRRTGLKGETNVDNLVAAFENMFDSTIERQNALRELDNSYKAAALNGGDNYGVGLIDSSQIDAVSGQVIRQWNKTPANTHVPYFPDNAKNVKSITGYAKLKNTEEDPTKMPSYQGFGFDERGIQDIAALYAGKDSRAMALDSMRSLNGSFNSLKVEAANVNEHLALLKALKESMNETGYARVSSDMAKWVENIRAAAGDARADEIKDILAPKAKP